jgi:hypothetical protein
MVPKSPKKSTGGSNTLLTSVHPFLGIFEAAQFLFSDFLLSLANSPQSKNLTSPSSPRTLHLWRPFWPGRSGRNQPHGSSDIRSLKAPFWGLKKPPFPKHWSLPHGSGMGPFGLRPGFADIKQFGLRRIQDLFSMGCDIFRALLRIVAKTNTLNRLCL